MAEQHEYRAAFFDHPNSQSSVEYGSWKTLAGLESAIERNFRGEDSQANLVSIRKVKVDDS